MLTRAEALRLISEGNTYAQAGERAGLAPDLEYLIATGVPADSSDGLSPAVSGAGISNTESVGSMTWPE